MKIFTRVFVFLSFCAIAIGGPCDGATLYNGIVLPEEWPPNVRSIGSEPMPVPYQQSPPAVIPIDVGRQLFVDDFLIHSTTLRRTFHKAAWHPASPVLRPEKPWEAKQESPGDPPQAMPFSDGVWYDSQDRLYKMWYMAGFSQSTCYAQSRDGIHWEKPDLDVAPGTNIVHAGTRDSATVWLDQETKDPDQRFKMMRRDNKTGRHTIHYSADGINWSEPVAATGAAFDRSTFFYNPFRQVWVLSLRGILYDPARESASGSFAGRKPYPKSDGMVSLPRMRRYVEGDDLASAAQSWPFDSVPQRYANSTIPIMWIGADRLDPPRPDIGATPELYNLDAVAYESLMVGLFSIWRGKPRDYPRRDKICDICVGFSRDGFHWSRPWREPILGVSDEENAWNRANVQSAGGCFLVVGEKLYFYASGRTARDIRKKQGASNTGLAVLRRDGFASMDADEQPGELTTRCVCFSGKHLFVNANTAGGELRVEVLDEHSRPIEPLTRENCIPIAADKTLQPVRWKGVEDLSELAGKPVRFRFHLRRGSLYSFWVSPDASGASRGYVAAGGPGFTGPTDTVGRK